LLYVAISAGLWVSLPIGMAVTSASAHGQSVVLDGALAWLWHSAPLLQIA